MYFRGLIVVCLFYYVQCFYNSTNPVQINSGRIPSYFDWRDKEAVSPVKNQGGSLACWAFSTVANIESHLKIYLEQKKTLSEQFLIDCLKRKDEQLSLLETFAQITSVLGGVLLQKDYFPYDGDYQGCRWNRAHAKPVPVVGFKRVLSDENVMVKYLYYYGPLSAAINSASMVNYEPNVIDEPTEEQCSSDAQSLNHAVLIVGYNVYVDEKTGKEVPYWIIKNSWGTEWGDKGFYYLVRGRNACGIANDVSFSMVV